MQPHAQLLQRYRRRRPSGKRQVWRRQLVNALQQELYEARVRLAQLRSEVARPAPPVACPEVDLAIAAQRLLHALANAPCVAAAPEGVHALMAGLQGAIGSTLQGADPMDNIVDEEPRPHVREPASPTSASRASSIERSGARHRSPRRGVHQST